MTCRLPCIGQSTNIRIFVLTSKSPFTLTVIRQALPERLASSFILSRYVRSFDSKASHCAILLCQMSPEIDDIAVRRIPAFTLAQGLSFRFPRVAERARWACESGIVRHCYRADRQSECDVLLQMSVQDVGQVESAAILSRISSCCCCGHIPPD